MSKDFLLSLTCLSGSQLLKPLNLHQQKLVFAFKLAHLSLALLSDGLLLAWDRWANGGLCSWRLHNYLSDWLGLLSLTLCCLARQLLDFSLGLLKLLDVFGVHGLELIAAFLNAHHPFLKVLNLSLFLTICRGELG